MKNKSTNLILIISVILLVLFSFTFVYLLNIIKNKNNHISAVSITLGRKMAEKQNITALEKKMTELVSIQKQISNYFVDTSNIDKFVEYLENVGSVNGSEVSVNSVDPIKNDKTKILVSLSINGSFSEVVKSIAIIENSPYGITINSLYLNKETIQQSVTASTPIDTKVTANTKVNPKTIETPVVKKSLWGANISFSVLNL